MLCALRCSCRHTEPASPGQHSNGCRPDTGTCSVLRPPCFPAGPPAVLRRHQARTPHERRSERALFLTMLKGGLCVFFQSPPKKYSPAGGGGEVPAYGQCDVLPAVEMHLPPQKFLYPFFYEGGARSVKRNACSVMKLGESSTRPGPGAKGAHQATEPTLP